MTRSLFTAFAALAFAAPVAAQDAPASYFGTVKAAQLEGLSYGARGCITEVSVAARTGRVASAGQVLVRLDDQRSQLALRTAAARVEDLKAAVAERSLALEAARADAGRRSEERDFVAKEFERNKVLLSRGLINETAMETVERRFMDARFAADRAAEAIDTALSAVRRAEIALEIGALERATAEINHDKLTLTAPIDGALIGFDANVGDCVQEGELAGQIYAPAAKTVEIFFLISRLSASERADVSVGAPVTFTRVNGETCSGTISRLDTEADLETQYVEATIDVAPACAPGLFLNEAVEVRPAAEPG